LQVIFPGKVSGYFSGENIRLFFRARSPAIFPAKTSGYFSGENIRLFFRARSPIIFPAKTSGDIRNPFRLVEFFPVSNLKKKKEKNY
jgi:hypothetical protein